jgi:hypothetical protein
MNRLCGIVMLVCLLSPGPACCQGLTTDEAMTEHAIRYFNRIQNDILSSLRVSHHESLDSTRRRVTFEGLIKTPFEGIPVFAFKYNGEDPNLHGYFFRSDSGIADISNPWGGFQRLLSDSLLHQVNSLLHRGPPLDRDRFELMISFLDIFCPAMVLQDWKGIDADKDHTVPDSIKQMIVPPCTWTTPLGYGTRFYAWESGGAGLFQVTVESEGNVIKYRERFLGVYGLRRVYL